MSSAALTPLMFPSREWSRQPPHPSELRRNRPRYHQRILPRRGTSRDAGGRRNHQGRPRRARHWPRRSPGSGACVGWVLPRVRGACEREAVAGISERVQARVKVDFPDHTDQVVESLSRLAGGTFPGEAPESANTERIQLAALLLAQGHLRRLDGAVALGLTDWRDLLVAADLANEDWRDRVDVELAPPAAMHIWVTRRGRPAV
jgi:hypothetical protein